MKEYIVSKIKEIESAYHIKVLYACETGSRAWGFPSPDSDYDIRIIYRHDPDWYLSLSEKKDTLETMLDNGELDITGWDIRKCLKLMWKSNGALLERVQSPIVYHEEQQIASLLLAYSEKCFSPIATMHHYMGMARNSFSDIEGKEHVKLKKLFYALRATLACKWILDKDSVPPIVFSQMVDELDLEVQLKERIRELIALKSGESESYLHPKEEELNHFISETLNLASGQSTQLGGRKDQSVNLDQLFLEILKNY